MSGEPIPAEAKRLAMTTRADRYSFGGVPELVDVVKRTPAQITVKTASNSTRKFWAKDGSEVGGRSSVEVVTPEITDRIQRHRYRSAVQSVCYKIEEAVRQQIAHNKDLEKLPLDKLQFLLKQLQEQHALLGDWTKMIARLATAKDPGPVGEGEPGTE